MTSRVVFGKEAKDLTVAEQFVLASAVNKPIILHARQRQAQRGAARPLALHHRGARAHLRRAADRRRGRAEDASSSSSSAWPAGRPTRASSRGCRKRSRRMRPALAKRALRQPDHPRQRADAGGALRLARGDEAGLRLRLARARARRHHHARRGREPELPREDQGAARPSSTRNTRARSTPATRSIPTKARAPDGDRKMPDVIVVAANAKGEIVRYFEAGETASYFGSPMARSSASGHYDAVREGRMIASTGKILAAIGIANAQQRPTRHALSRPGRAGARRARRLRQGSGRGGARPASAIVAFACSLNQPHRMARGAARPAAHAPADRPVRLQSAAGAIAPRRRHRLDCRGARADRRLAAARAPDGGGGAGVADASRATGRCALPTLVKAYDYHLPRGRARPAAIAAADASCPIGSSADAGRPLLKTLLQAPLCYSDPVCRTARSRAWRVVPGQAHRSEAALRQDRHVGGPRHQCHGRHLDRRRPAVQPTARPTPTSC